MFHSLSEESESRNFICAPVPTKSFSTLPKYCIEQENYDTEKLENDYKETHAEFTLTYRSEIIIRRIINQANPPREYQGYPLLKLLIEIACEMMMSELELVSFSIYLNRLVWPFTVSHFTILLYSVAFTVKYQYCNNLDPLIVHLKSKIPNFLQFLNTWMMKFDDFLKIEYLDLNKAFNTLTKAPYSDIMIDYNFYVDSILEMAPASVYEKPIWQEQLLSVPNITETYADIPMMARLDSVLNEFPDIPNMGRAFSTTSNMSFFTPCPDFGEI